MKLLEPTSAVIRAANGQKLDICGQLQAIITGKTQDNKNIVTETVIHVSRNVSGFFLSKDTLIELSLLILWTFVGEIPHL